MMKCVMCNDWGSIGLIPRAEKGMMTCPHCKGTGEEPIPADVKKAAEEFVKGVEKEGGKVRVEGRTIVIDYGEEQK